MRNLQLLKKRNSDVDPQLVTKVISSWANGLSLFVPSLVQPEVQPRVYTEVNESTGYNSRLAILG